MKRIASVLLGICIICNLSACFFWDNLPQDTFFSDESLSTYTLTGMPVPNLKNSRLKGDTLYCNLTMEEYEAYVSSVLTWLQSREDIYHLGSYCSSGLYGEMLPYRIYSFLPEDYDCRGTSHDFAFSATDTPLDDFMDEPIRVSIYRKNGTLNRGRFTYNTVIDIGTILSAYFDPCHRQHSYGGGTPYPVPGLNRNIHISHCVYCGAKTQDWYLDSSTSYAVKVTEGRGYIRYSNYSTYWNITSLYSGLTLEITVANVDDGDLVMLVNGESIPKLRDDGAYSTFGFIMPQCDIEIQIRVKTE